MRPLHMSPMETTDLVAESPGSMHGALPILEVRPEAGAGAAEDKRRHFPDGDGESLL